MAQLIQAVQNTYNKSGFTVIEWIVVLGLAGYATVKAIQWGATWQMGAAFKLLLKLI